MQTVYVVKEHVEYEGYSITSLHSTEIGARRAVWRIVADHQRYNDAEGYQVKTTAFYEHNDGNDPTHIVPFDASDGVDQWFTVEEKVVWD